MTAYTVLNGTEAQLTAVDGGSTNVEANTYKDGITLTNAQVAALCAQPGVAVTSDLTAVANAAQLKRAIATAAQYVSA